MFIPKCEVCYVRIGIEMEPIHHDDDEEFLHSIIREDTQHEGPFEGDAPEYDGSKYLNDTGDDNADQQEEMTMEDIGAKVYGIRAYIYINMI